MCANNAYRTIAALLFPALTATPSDAPSLLPVPKRVNWGEERIAVGEIRRAPGADRAIVTGIGDLRTRIGALGGKAAGAVVWAGSNDEMADLTALLGRQMRIPEEAGRPDGYVLRCVKAGGRDVVVCLGHDARGCYYGIQTLTQLLQKDGNSVTIPRVDIVDWPSFPVRLVKNSASRGNPAVVERVARLLPRYKINVYALQYHSGRGGTWRKPSEKYVTNIETVGAMAREAGALDPALFLCPFFKPRIDVSKPEEVDFYVERLKWGLRQGFKWIEVDFNDWGTWKSVNQAERDRFGDMGQYTAHLTNAAYKGVRAEFPDTGVIVCSSPSFYRGHAKPELVTLCRLIPEDVLVYWTGLVTRSRHISERQILDWTKATGRKPFLWDNTIYSHFQPYWVGYSLNPFWNSFPSDLPELLAGGIHLNSNATDLYVPGLLTFADYVWNPEAYDPERSIRAAMRLCWGDEAGAAAQSVREHLTKVHGMLEEAAAGIAKFDRVRAEKAVESLDNSVKRFGEVSEDAGLTAQMERAIVANAKKAVKEFVPPDALAKDGTYVRKPLADGVVNGGAEEMAEGKPVNWCLYSGGAKGKVIASTDAHNGKFSACLEVLEWYHNPEHAKHGDRKWLNIALVHGSDRKGYTGGDAYDVEPGKTYRCTFWLKGDVPWVTVLAQGWRMGFTSGRRVSLDTYPMEIQPTRVWEQHTISFTTSFGVRKLALKFCVMGYEDAGARLGSIWVDDLQIAEE